MNEIVYTYDMEFDPITNQPISYDTEYFFFDGEIDITYLQGLQRLPTRKKRGVSGKPSKTKKVYPESDFVELVFKSSIIDFEKEKTTTYKVGKKDDVVVKVKDLTIFPKRPIVSSEIIKRVGTAKLKISSDILPKK